jgi:hypothetical protein
VSVYREGGPSAPAVVTMLSASSRADPNVNSRSTR